MTSLGKFPDPFLSEIAAQPDAVRRAARALNDQREALRGLAEASGRTVVFTGMGGSFHTCYAAVVELARRGIPALHVAASELLHFRRPILDERALVVAVSQSGESAEVVQLAEALRRSRSRPLLASITNGLANRLAERSDLALDTRAGEERGPSTMTFAASLVTLSAVAQVLGGVDGAQAVDRTGEAAEQAAAAMQELLVDPEGWAEELAGWHEGRQATVVLGRGPARAASEMGALLLKESAGVAAEALETGQFRHGPFELADTDLAAIVVATEPETKRLDLALAADLVASGAAALVVTPDGEVPRGARGMATGPVDRSLSPAVSIVPAQLLAWGLAVVRGRTPGVLTRATKVTTRE